MLHESHYLWANEKLRIVLTGECNINCFYCHNEGQPKSHNYFSDRLFAHLIEIIRLNGQRIRSVKFSGGEPLLHTGLEKYLQTISNYTDSRSIVTNGLLLNENRLKSLLDAGLDKIRLGVDSLCKNKSRPSNLYNSTLPIHTVINYINKHSVDFEFNIVITNYNWKEIPHLLLYCKENSISAKFIEMIKVSNFGTETITANLKSRPLHSFVSFREIVLQVIPECVECCDIEMGDANHLFLGKTFEIRYCRHLCEYNKCHKTGTRVDPDGIVHTCMGQRGKFKITPDDPPALSIESIKLAVVAGCAMSNINKV